MALSFTFSSLEIMLGEVLSFLHLICLRFSRCQRGQNWNIMWKETIQHWDFFFFFKEFDFTLAQVKVQFISYFIHTFCPPLEGIPSPWVPPSFCWCSVLFSLVPPNPVVLWSGLDLSQHLKYGLPYILHPRKTNSFGSFLFNTSKFIAQLWTLLFYSYCSRDES